MGDTHMSSFMISPNAFTDAAWLCFFAMSFGALWYWQSRVLTTIFGAVAIGFAMRLSTDDTFPYLLGAVAFLALVGYILGRKLSRVAAEWLIAIPAMVAMIVVVYTFLKT